MAWPSGPPHHAAALGGNLNEGDVVHAEADATVADWTGVRDGALVSRCSCYELAKRPSVSFWPVNSVRTERDRR